MHWLILGLLLFLSIHCLPHFQSTRASFTQKLGPAAYRGIFSLLSAIGLGLIVVGMIEREFVHLWTPPLWSKEWVIGAMLPASILLCAANFPNNIRRLSRHPMLIGLLLWSGSHLLANGDLASLLLFGGFLLFAIFDLWSVTGRQSSAMNQRLPLWLDAIAVTLGVGIYAALLIWHGQWFGVTLIAN